MYVQEVLSNFIIYSYYKNGQDVLDKHNYMKVLSHFLTKHY